LEKHLSVIQSLVQEISRREARDQESSAADSLVTDIRSLSGRIRSESQADESCCLSESEIKSLIDSLDHRINETIKRLRGAIQEEKRLKQLEQELKKEEERKRIEEEKRRQDEELKKRKADLEAKFLIENSAPPENNSSHNHPTSDHYHQQQHPHGRSQEMDDRSRKEAVSVAQQETLDHELAIRIARENGSSCDQVSPVLLPRSLTSSSSVTKGFLNSKYEYLTKWKYSELRDTINTSCDIDLLEACKAEFHRRLKVYHEWKAKNAKNNMSNNSINNNGSIMFDAGMPHQDGYEGDRAPACIMQNGFRSNHNHHQQTSAPGGLNGRSSSSKVTESRFFRIPFVRPSLVSGQKGWWFAHFEGQWIARQMELHPEKPAILLVAGMRRIVHHIVSRPPLVAAAAFSPLFFFRFPPPALLF
jgi:myosin-6